MPHCDKCLAYYPDGFDHQCIPWMAALVELRTKKSPLDIESLEETKEYEEE